MAIELETPRLRFRSWRGDDAELAGSLWGDPRVTAHIDARDRLDDRAVRRRLDEEIETERAHGIQYAPFYLRSTGEFAGCCGFRPRSAEEGRHVLELGVHVRAELWKHGLATEAARAMISYGFETLGATALFAGHDPGNEASRALLSKLGFRYTHDEPYEPTGLEHPSYIMTRRDWELLNER